MGGIPVVVGLSHLDQTLILAVDGEPLTVETQAVIILLVAGTLLPIPTQEMLEIVTRVVDGMLLQIRPTVAKQIITLRVDGTYHQVVIPVTNILVLVLVIWERLKTVKMEALKISSRKIGKKLQRLVLVLT